MTERSRVRKQGPTRREILKGSLQAVLIAPLTVRTPQKAVPQPATPSPRFFTADEFQMVDELTELVIPTDDHSPGARAAKVAQYIDDLLADSKNAARRELWREGLKTVGEVSIGLNGEPFMKASPEGRIAVLTRLSAGEASPSKPGERFFVDLKGLTVKGYYTSSIGIHQEMEYKGNVYLREYIGESLPS